MQLIIESSGNCRCVYSEEIDLRLLGNARIERGSYVEPHANGQWTADLSPVEGPVLGPFSTRSEALAAEVNWLVDYWVNPSATGFEVL